MNKKRKKLIHFRQFQELKKNIGISHPNINLCKDGLSEVRETKNGKKIHDFLKNHLKDFLIFDHHQQLKYVN